MSTPGTQDSKAHRLFKVDEDSKGIRLDRFLASQLPEISRSQLSQLIVQGQVSVDHEPARPALRLRPGSAVRVNIPAPTNPLPQPEALPLAILHEDADLLVLNKAAGMVVHPAEGAPSGTLVNALLHHLGSREALADTGDLLRPGIVHRLDKDTSGVMVVAKSELALSKLKQGFQERSIKKHYLALVHGLPPSPTTLDTPFGRHPVDRVRMTGKFKDEGEQEKVGRRAVTHFRVLEYFHQAASLLEIDLETGRTHQIRVHLSEANHPLLGDATYGGTRREKRAISPIRHASATLNRQALHAHTLSFSHPKGGETMNFQAPLPEDFLQALAILRQA